MNRNEQIDKADRLAIQIVTLVCEKLYNGKLYAYDGIQAAREIRSLMLKTFATNAKARTPIVNANKRRRRKSKT